MQEIDQPVLRLEAPRNLDPNYRRAIDLLTTQEPISIEEMSQYWDELPYLQDYSEGKSGAILARIDSANTILSDVRDFIFENILNKGKEASNSTFLDEFILSEAYSQRLGFSQREYQIATAHVIFGVFADALSRSPEPKKSLHFDPLRYYGVIQDLLIEVRTSSYAFFRLVQKGEIDLSLVDRIKIPIVFSDKGEVLEAQMYSLFDGSRATPLKTVDGMTYSVISRGSFKAVLESEDKDKS